jgi:hypothetical protein
MFSEKAFDGGVHIDGTSPAVAVSCGVLALALETAHTFGLGAGLIRRQVRLAAETDPAHPPLKPNAEAVQDEPVRPAGLEARQTVVGDPVAALESGHALAVDAPLDPRHVPSPRASDMQAVDASQGVR